MNRQWIASMAVFTALISFSSFSANDKGKNEVFSVDRIVSDDVSLNFTNDNDIQPNISNFTVVNYVLMSNEKGDRRAVVTLENQSSGSRIFQHDQIMALIGDGKRISPRFYKQKFKAGESISMTLSFGNHLNPILQIYTRK
ncbi:hypothetical protein FM038_016590 [Shewanella eurypsychrophilus]|uniref:DUF4426 domain-containing protein n=1 Tax=Shewanella eurypsychrophilus TaxID=2593656 RepID=A0ABX6V877_9GAMM|nr:MULTISPECIES: hypothetical protein [Shewanella]QFU23632.1 hypothetical protein FS418_18390 [Shewanella sp. YLB-09]QPG58854.1 hypothetical protein FM038_016590 [Shewanella eurypsychrophilus]